MKLLTKKIRNKLPKLYAQEKESDPVVYVKFFAPWGRWTWYATEGEPVLDDSGNEIDFRFFGYVVGLDPWSDEWGYFVLSELQEAEGPWRLKIERDLWFDPQPASEIEGIALP